MSNKRSSPKAKKLVRDLSEAEIRHIAGGHGDDQSCTCPPGTILLSCNNGVGFCAFF